MHMTIEQTLLQLTDALNRFSNLFDNIGDEEGRQLVFDFVKQQGTKPLDVQDLDKGNGEDKAEVKSAPKKKRRRRRTKAEMQAAREAEARAKVEQEEAKAAEMETAQKIIDEIEGKNLPSDSDPTKEEPPEDDVDFYLQQEGAESKEETEIPASMDEIVEQAIEANTDPLRDITQNDVRDVVRELIFRQMNNEARTVLAKYGVRKVADLPQDQWEKCHDELKSLLEMTTN